MDGFVSNDLCFLFTFQHLLANLCKNPSNLGGGRKIWNRSLQKEHKGVGRW